MTSDWLLSDWLLEALTLSIVVTSLASTIVDGTIVINIMNVKTRLISLLFIRVPPGFCHYKTALHCFNLLITYSSILLFYYACCNNLINNYWVLFRINYFEA